MLNLTYNNKNLPPGYSLSMSDYQNFIKKLRHVTGPKLRFLGCGEYGEKFGRPHYHIILFNYRPPDTKLFERKETYNYYTSQIIEELWGNGNVILGDVSFDSIAYVARYCLKKVTGKKAAEHYQVLLPDGTRLNRLPEFFTQSRKPGIAFDYWQNYKSEILTHDNIIVNGHPSPVPRYYDKLISETDANMHWKMSKSILDTIKTSRRQKALANIRKEGDNSSRRRRSKELFREYKLKQKARLL